MVISYGQAPEWTHSSIILTPFVPCQQESLSLYHPSQQRPCLLLLLSRFSHVRLCATPEMAAHQAPLSLGFSRQEHWSGLSFALLEWLLNVFGVQCNCQIEACKSLLHSLPSHPCPLHTPHTPVFSSCSIALSPLSCTCSSLFTQPHTPLFRATLHTSKALPIP